MAKESSLRGMVFVGIGLVIAGAVFSAFVSIPRMAMHPEVIEDGAVASSRYFSFIIPLIVAGFLLASFFLTRQNLKRIKAILIVAEVVVIILSLMISKQAGYYLESYGFQDMAIPEFLCAGAFLIAGILLIVVSVKINRPTSSE